jgi:hypothetical protein
VEGRRRQPVGTGSLGRKTFPTFVGQVTALGGRVGHVEDDMKELKKEAATTKDIERSRADRRKIETCAPR